MKPNPQNLIKDHNLRGLEGDSKRLREYQKWLGQWGLLAYKCVPEGHYVPWKILVLGSTEYNSGSIASWLNHGLNRYLDQKEVKRMKKKNHYPYFADGVNLEDLEEAGNGDTAARKRVLQQLRKAGVKNPARYLRDFEYGF